MKRLILITLIALTAAVASCGEPTISVENTETLEMQYRDTSQYFHRGAKLIGEDCASPNDCESGVCLDQGICSQYCAVSGCPLSPVSDPTRLWTTLCVPIPGRPPVCAKICDAQTTCPSGRTTCTADPTSPVQFCQPTVAQPPPTPLRIGEECPTNDCGTNGICVKDANYVNGICTSDCATIPCPADSTCTPIMTVMRCLKLCSTPDQCPATGSTCAPEGLCH